MPPTRRHFLQQTTATAGLGVAGLDFLAALPRVSAEEAKPDPSTVRFRPEIEPLVRLLEDTPRERVLEDAPVQRRTAVSPSASGEREYDSGRQGSTRLRSVM